MFIVFEGVDGSGKDTQLNRVFEYIRDHNKNQQIWVTKEPTGNTVSGKTILEKLAGEGFLDGQEALKLYVADREEQTSIRRDIIQHSVILSSRFDYSTYAYQGVQGLSFDEIYNAHNYDTILIPDITFVFDVSRKNIEARLSNRGGEKEFFENIDFLCKVQDKYLDTAERLKSEREIYIIDANSSIDDVFEEIRKILDIYL